MRSFSGPAGLEMTAPGLRIVRVEELLDLLGQLGDPGAELGGKQRLLEAADALFAGDRAAERDGQFHDLGERERGTFLRRFVGRVEDDGRIRVPSPACATTGPARKNTPYWEFPRR
jgi:hypothetical protein